MHGRICILGVPMWLGQGKYGANFAPDALRAAGLVARLRQSRHSVCDEGDVPVTLVDAKPGRAGVKNLSVVVHTNRLVAERVASIVQRRDFPLILGGDHSIAIGTIAGIAGRYQNLGVIWFDAHADMNTPFTSPSGNIHGMPLAVAMGFGHPLLTGIGGRRGRIRPENIVMLGVRDIDAGERLFMQRRNIKVVSVREIAVRGIRPVLTEAVDYLSDRCDGIHLSFDLDGLDPAVAPGVGTPSPGGVDYQDTLAAVKCLFQADVVTSAEIVELNPLLDRDLRTVSAAVTLVGALFGVSEAAVPAMSGGVPGVYDPHCAS